ncbi:extracellular solute-binding protein, family 5 [Trichormus variabilis ATCC 29413]|uniref:Extracellular solute-binding protein, family 5 n=2 Tax=Anabaena variabilis TaxID=264691 RepID=Q3MCV0_TRIV2|nr:MULTISPECIES: peptide ABC transporter substrate-binding protein [Nostocaceae]ABA21186.1 extracellular solute-binding protein, family 5 [Trichormus variabilis ATCC 29413]MBC1214117.1 peptide ABC transporter substrate-binding protein [Trichormus variabilis ARAD]MBC1258580.1 peptide ABC transporter substrate-binding protein [Trichormus variabilis V5]MBC1268387.1 peptide ABC transporter substrate-binding protein [Trichormus variabilis FSR]MBC1304061.1 peptide ABC transporter substrate-binding p
MGILNKFRQGQIFTWSLLNIFFLAGCSFPQAETPTNSTPVTNTSTGETLRLLYWQAPTILNPHLAQGTKDFEASRIVYEPLASHDKDGKLVLFLAAEEPTLKNGGIAKDGKSVTWKLKQGVKWSDGQPFTAADVVFTYKFLSNPAVGATTSANYEAVQSVEAIDDYTVKINFQSPNPAWSLPFVGLNGMIIPRHIFEKFNGSNAREAPGNLIPIGTGPYKVGEFKPGDTIIYEANSVFREANKPFFKRVELKGGGDATSAARAVLQTGDVDYAWNLQVEAPILKQLEAAGKGKLKISFGSFLERITINHTDPNKQTKDGERSSTEFPHPFFQDIKVRQAFNYAIDRDTINQQLYGSSGRPAANILLAPEIYNSPNTKYEFSPKKATDLLDEAGWKDTNGNGIRDKNGVEMNVLLQTSVNPVRQKTQEIIKQGLTSIGVGVELKSIDGSIFFSGDPSNPDTLGRFQADLQMFSTGSTNVDPGAYMKGFTCSEIPQKKNNWSKSNHSRYCNPEYDKLWQQSNTELNPEKRRLLFIQMNDLLFKDIALIPLIARADVNGVSNRLVGVDLTPWDTDTWNIKDWQQVQSLGNR